MLPTPLLNYRRAENGRIIPSFLTSRDEVWLTTMVDELPALAGRSVDAADERIRERVVPIARRHGIVPKVVQGVWAIERRRWRSRVDAPIAPEKIRTVLFRAAVGRARADALQVAASTLGISEDAVDQCLFADRPGARLLDPPAAAAVAAPLTTVTSLVEAYNLALVQSLLARSINVIAVVRAHARKVVGYAKLRGLMATFEQQADNALQMSVSGPLALFHETIKYGRALAGLLPALAVTPGWFLRAQVALEGTTYEMHLDGSAPLPRTHQLPRAFDSMIERRLAIDLRRLGTGWEIEREAAVVRAGRRLFFPDFTLVSPSGRGSVLVEVVGFWTPEYLASKAEMLQAVQVPMVVCMEARHMREGMKLGLDPSRQPNVIVFRDRVDAAALVSAAERALNASFTGRTTSGSELFR